MTRINCIPFQELTSQHLVAEYRELPRIFGLVERTLTKGSAIDNLPREYVLGTGHCKFFYNKLGYLTDRHQGLVKEMLSRGYKPQFTGSLKESYKHIPEKFYGDWKPDSKAMEINRARIKERLK